MQEALGERGDGKSGREGRGQQDRGHAGPDAGSGRGTAHDEHVEEGRQTLGRYRSAKKKRGRERGKDKNIGLEIELCGNGTTLEEAVRRENDILDGNWNDEPRWIGAF